MRANGSAKETHRKDKHTSGAIPSRCAGELWRNRVALLCAVFEFCFIGLSLISCVFAAELD